LGQIDLLWYFFGLRFQERFLHLGKLEEALGERVIGLNHDQWRALVDSLA
jgi:hypothetical protein